MVVSAGSWCVNENIPRGVHQDDIGMCCTPEIFKLSILARVAGLEGGGKMTHPSIPPIILLILVNAGS